MVLKPWVLIATLLLQNPDGLDLSSLAEQTDWLRHLALAFGAFLDWPGKELASQVCLAQCQFEQRSIISSFPPQITRAVLGSSAIV